MDIVIKAQTDMFPLNQLLPLQVFLMPEIVKNKVIYMMMTSTRKGELTDFSFGEPTVVDDREIACVNLSSGEVEYIQYDTLVRLYPSVLTIGNEEHNEIVPPGSLSLTELAECRAGRKISAIKMVRERTRLGLKEAKDIVDAVCHTQGIGNVGAAW